MKKSLKRMLITYFRFQSKMEYPKFQEWFKGINETESIHEDIVIHLEKDEKGITH